MSKKKKIRKNSVVKLDRNVISDEMYESYKELDKMHLIFLGEIKQCPGHCILLNLKSGKIIGMYHTENFREATEDEV